MIYATALGIYSIFLDQEKVSDSYFAPGYTEYNNRCNIRNTMCLLF